MMDEQESNSLRKLNKMLEDFETLHCNGNNGHAIIPFRSYTNFTVHEILKPSFGITSMYTYDSDSAYTSDNYDHYSSSDDAHDSESVRSVTPEERMSHCQIPSCSCKSEAAPRHHVSLSNTDRVASWSERVRRQFEDDGYSSSDSESALDLRIQRKKTPPKTSPDQIPAWVFCTRYSDRPSAGPRSRRNRAGQREPRRARTAFNDQQLNSLNIEFERDQYLSESRRQKLADELNLNEASIKIWFQNKRAKLKKDAVPHALALELHARGLYNHKVSPAC